jgi:hypothetical protein
MSKNKPIPKKVKNPNGRKTWLKVAKKVHELNKKEKLGWTWSESMRFASKKVYPKFKGQAHTKVKLADITSEFKVNLDDFLEDDFLGYFLFPYQEIVLYNNKKIYTSNVSCKNKNNEIYFVYNLYKNKKNNDLKSNDIFIENIKKDHILIFKKILENEKPQFYFFSSHSYKNSDVCLFIQEVK